jgi:hypothetical protein
MVLPEDDLTLWSMLSLPQTYPAFQGSAGWRQIGEVKGRSWDTPSRRRTDKHPTEDKLLWECAA